MFVFRDETIFFKNSICADLGWSAMFGSGLTDGSCDGIVDSLFSLQFVSVVSMYSSGDDDQLPSWYGKI